MIDRRSFLGSMIGLVCSQPFFARLWHESVQDTKYRMLFRDSLSGFTIQAPDIESITFKDGAFEICAHKLEVIKTMAVDQCVLLTKKGQVIQRSNFGSKVYLVNGDALIVRQTLRFDVPGNDLDVLIERWLCWKR